MLMAVLAGTRSGYERARLSAQVLERVRMFDFGA